jgi:hypothetical protein
MFILRLNKDTGSFCCDKDESPGVGACIVNVKPSIQVLSKMGEMRGDGQGPLVERRHPLIEPYRKYAYSPRFASQREQLHDSVRKPCWL